MSSYDAEFWGGSGEYQDLAEMFERNIAVVHPSGAKCWCSKMCPWQATCVDYYRYDGESIK